MESVTLKLHLTDNRKPTITVPKDIGIEALQDLIANRVTKYPISRLYQGTIYLQPDRKLSDYNTSLDYDRLIRVAPYQVSGAQPSITPIRQYARNARLAAHLENLRGPAPRGSNVYYKSSVLNILNKVGTKNNKSPTKNNKSAKKEKKELPFEMQKEILKFIGGKTRKSKKSRRQTRRRR